jgi:hypothetical protein
MLPFLKNTQEGSASSPIEPIKRESDHEEDYDGLHACAEDLHAAVKSGDIPGIASALKAAFQICDSEPHEEGDHI